MRRRSSRAFEETSKDVTLTMRLCFQGGVSLTIGSLYSAMPKYHFGRCSEQAPSLEGYAPNSLDATLARKAGCGGVISDDLTNSVAMITVI